MKIIKLFFLFNFLILSQNIYSQQNIDIDKYYEKCNMFRNYRMADSLQFYANQILKIKPNDTLGFCFLQSAIFNRIFWFNPEEQDSLFFNLINSFNPNSEYYPVQISGYCFTLAKHYDQIDKAISILERHLDKKINYSRFDFSTLRTLKKLYLVKNRAEDAKRIQSIINETSFLICDSI